MDIRIYRKNNDDLIEINKIRWKLFSKRSFFEIRLFVLLGTLILIMHFLTLGDGENFWGFIPSLGLGILLLALVYTYHMIKARRKYMTRTLEIISRHKNQDQGIEITITDTNISSKDFQMFTDTKWSVFLQYKLYKNYLFLIIDDQNLNSVIIDRNEITEAEFTWLYEFVKERMPERK